MKSGNLDQLNTDIQHLTLPEQVWLMERLAQYIHVNTLRQQQLIESQLVAMANDPDVQREIHEIQAEFAATENDGLLDQQ